MSKIKFTPGPLKTFIKGNVVEVQDEFGKSVIKWTGFDACSFKLNVQKANAILFATAPDLYMELEKQLEYLKVFDSGNKSILRIEKLLAKARGEK